MRYLIYTILISCFFIACKEDTPVELAAPTELEKAAENLKAEGTDASAALYIQEVRKALTQTKDPKEIKTLLDKGLETAKKYKIQKEVLSFLVPLVKDYPNDENAEEHFSNLILGIIPNNKIAGNIMAAGYLNKYPNGEYKSIIENVQTINMDNPVDHLEALGKSIFENPDDQGVNKAAARKYVDASEAYAISFPDMEDAPSYLFKAAEISRSLGTYNKSMSMFDWITSHYADSEEAPTAYFLKGFMLDNDFGNIEAAKKEYTTFLEKYPEHPLYKDVKFLSDNLGKTDEELMKVIEQAKK